MDLFETGIRSKDGNYRAVISYIGGFLKQAYYKDFEIFYNAPWRTEGSDLSKLDVLTCNLGGTFTCVPFGAVNEDRGNFRKNYPHGISCNATWTLLKRGDDFVTLSFAYPHDFDIFNITKTIKLDEKGIHIDVEIDAHNDVTLPFGEHPCFNTKNGVHLDIKGRAIGYPFDVEKSSLIAHSSINESLDKVLLRTGEYRSFTNLPLLEKTENIVQMIEPQGLVILTYKKERKQIKFTWDSDTLPSCLVWLSNAGRDYFPWNGRNYCVGIEPIASAFDLPELMDKENVLTKLNVKTGHHFKKDIATKVFYNFEVRDL